MIRFGIVTQLDPAGARVRVKFPEEDTFTDTEEPGLESYWLQVLHRWTLETKAYSMPAVGEQVACLMDGHLELGVVLGGLYSTADPRPAAPDTSVHLEFLDGTILEYDPAAHLLKADVQGGVAITTTGDVSADVGGDLSATATNATIEASAMAKIKGAAITLDGPVTVTGLLLVQGLTTLSAGVVFGGTATTSGGGAWSFTGSATFTGDLGAAAVNATGAVDSISGVTKGGAPYNFP